MDTRRNQNGMKEQGALHRQAVGAFLVQWSGSVVG